MRTYRDFDVYKEIKEILSKPNKLKNCFLCDEIIFKHRIVCQGCFGKHFIKLNGNSFEGLDFIRELVRIRDNHTCQKCGKIWENGKRRFDVHHLFGICGKLSRTYDRLDTMDGLITYCHKCHLNLDEVKEKMLTKSSPRSNKPVPASILEA